MRKREERFLQQIVTIRHFLRDKMPGDPQLVALREKFDASAERARALELPARTYKDRGDIADARRNLKEALRYNHLLRISRHGKPLLRWTKGSEAALKVAPKRATVEEHVDSALRMAKFLRPHAALFVRDGFPRDFRNRMKAAATAIRDRQALVDATRKARAKAETAIRAEMKTLRDLLTALEGGLMEHSRKNPPFAVAWLKARRIGPGIGRPRKRRKRE